MRETYNQNKHNQQQDKAILKEHQIISTQLTVQTLIYSYASVTLNKRNSWLRAWIRLTQIKSLAGLKQNI